MNATFSDSRPVVESTCFEPSLEDRAWAAELFDRLDQERYQAEKDRRSVRARSGS